MEEFVIANLQGTYMCKLFKPSLRRRRYMFWAAFNTNYG